MPSPDTLILALLIVAVLAVELAILWLLTTTRRTQSKTTAHALRDIPMPAEPFPPVAPPSESQAVLDARYAQARRREQRETRRLAESEWYGGGGIGTVPWGRDDNDYLPWREAR